MLPNWLRALLGMDPKVEKAPKAPRMVPEWPTPEPTIIHSVPGECPACGANKWEHPKYVRSADDSGVLYYQSLVHVCPCGFNRFTPINGLRVTHLPDYVPYWCGL